MAIRRPIAIVRVLATMVSLACFFSLPASGQQAVGAGLFGGPPPCTAGSNPALFDHNHNGPTADDLPAYLESNPTAGTLVVHFPSDGCFGLGSRELPIWEGTSGNPWPGSMNSVDNIVGGLFEATVADQNNDFIGGTYNLGIPYALALLPSPDVIGAYDRVQATSPGPTLTGGIQGWDLAPADGVPDYIGLSWSGLTIFENCPSYPDLDDTMMLWVPVVPYDPAGGGPAGAVTIRFDLNCDGSPDGGYPSAPPIVPETTMPVDLQSFTIASVLPSSKRGYALAFLFCVLPIGALGLARRWLSGIDI